MPKEILLDSFLGVAFDQYSTDNESFSADKALEGEVVIGQMTDFEKNCYAIASQKTAAAQKKLSTVNMETADGYLREEFAIKLKEVELFREMMTISIKLRFLDQISDTTGIGIREGSKIVMYEKPDIFGFPRKAPTPVEGTPLFRTCDNTDEGHHGHFYDSNNQLVENGSYYSKAKAKEAVVRHVENKIFREVYKEKLFKDIDAANISAD